MKKNRSELLCWVLAALPLALALCCLPTLPERIPLHWDLAGEIDGWGTRSSAFLIPAMTLGLNALFVLLPRIDPKRRNYPRFGGAYRAFRLMFNLFMLGMAAITLYSAYRPGALSVNKLIPAGVGALFCVMGNYMPKFKPNYFMGLRTPWTLASERVWHSTHRLAGALWFWGGLGFMGASFLLPPKPLFAALVALVALLAGVPCLYSYLAYRAGEEDGGGQK
ncbi:SdpI family protein [Anaerofilum sp. BX8]|uniref:SdpI family protein n=1 Tax=Anaerofilum hominis TaxID=2763016 RepID=A0A923L0V7_9FIRM|nr:SdpI family protein [Anaerofilum hominis]MBC5580972.1 SdpI family protein [Anaerofilum hominis]